MQTMECSGTLGVPLAEIRCWVVIMLHAVHGIHGYTVVPNALLADQIHKGINARLTRSRATF